jgi:hypothetical protein
MQKLEAEAKKGGGTNHTSKEKKHDSVLHFLEVYGIEFRKKPNRKGKQAVNGDYHGNWRISGTISHIRSKTKLLGSCDEYGELTLATSYHQSRTVTKQFHHP